MSRAAGGARAGVEAARIGALAGLALAACADLALVEPAARPQVLVIAPVADQAAPLGGVITVRARATAAAGTLARVQVYLPDPVRRSRVVPVIGAEAEVEVRVPVPRDAWRGPDGRRVDVVVTAEASVEGRTVVSRPAIVPVRLTDTTPPVARLSSPDARPSPPPGVDLWLPARRAVTLVAEGEDAAGGLARIILDAPPALGGPRSEALDGAAAGRLEAVVEAPDADLVVRVVAVDEARDPQRAERAYRVRFGAGGADGAGPTLGWTLDRAACGEPTVARVVAEDVSGVAELRAFVGPARAAVAGDGEATVTATVGLVAPRPAGATLALRAEARDRLGFTSARTATVTAIDARGPDLRSTGPLSIDGARVVVPVEALEACGTIADLRLTLRDAAGGAAVVVHPVGAATFAGEAAFPAPPELCALGTTAATLIAVDDAGLGSSPLEARLTLPDETPPTLALTASATAAPGRTITLRLDAADLAAGVASATITVDGTFAPPLSLQTAVRFEAPTCGRRGPRRLELDVPIPADVELGAAPTLRVRAEAADGRGNREVLQATLPVAARRLLAARATPRQGPERLAPDRRPPGALTLEAPRRTVGVGEVLGARVIRLVRDGLRRDESARAQWTSERPGVLAIDAAGLRAVATGTAAVIVELPGLRARATFRVVDDALFVTDDPLLLSPRPQDGAARPTEVALRVLRLSGGAATDVSDRVTWTARPPGVVSVTGSRARALVPGAARLVARLGARTATVAVTSAPIVAEPRATTR